MPRFTGERIIPDTPSLQYTFARHEVVYRAIANHLKHQQVIDCGCGEGYGSSILRQQAAAVVAIDRSPSTISDAQQKYVHQGITFIPQELEQTWPFTQQSFDAAVCCQVIEHLKIPELLLREMSRILKPSGWAVLSTPFRPTFSPTGDILDPYHFHEYDRQEYEQLLRKFFPTVSIYALTGNQIIIDHLHRDISSIRRIVALDLFRLRRWLPLSIKQWCYDVGLNTVRRLQYASGTVRPVTIQDFRITAKQIPDDHVLDLIAICGNSDAVLPTITWPL